MSGFRDDFSLVTASTVDQDHATGAAGVSVVAPATLDNNVNSTTNWPVNDSWFLRETGKLSYKPVFPASPPGLGDPPAGFGWDVATAFTLMTMPAPSPTGVAILGTYIIEANVVPYIGLPHLNMVNEVGTVLARLGGEMDFLTLRERPRLKAGLVVPHYSAFTRMWNADQSLWNSPAGLGAFPPDLGSGGVMPVYLRIECDNTTGDVRMSVTEDESGQQLVCGPWEDPNGLPGDGAALTAQVELPHFTMAGQGNVDAAPTRGIDPPDSTPVPLLSLLSWNYHVDVPSLSAGSHQVGVIPH